MVKDKRREIVFNLINIVAVFCSVVGYFIGGSDPLGGTGTTCFNYFTIDSNVYMALVSSIWLIYLLKGKEISFSLSIFRYSSTVAVTLTFLVTTLFLGPIGYLNGGIDGYLNLFRGNVFFLHFLCPIISIISFITYSKNEKISFKDSLYCLLPTIAYGTVYFYQVVLTKKWIDFYGFTFGGHYKFSPIIFIIMLLVTWLIAIILRKLKIGFTTFE